MYTLPPLRLFDDPALPIEDSYEAGDLLMDALTGLGLRAELITAQVGPTVTRYEVRPGIGERMARFAGLSNDLACALAAASVRIEAPIPGKNTVGIEVPNAAPAVVTISEILPRAVASSALLPVALGKDMAGNPLLIDLARMPHLLVAGATGGGKSVCLNGIIASLLAALTPEVCELVLIDPKRVELTQFAGIPHLRGDVVTDVREAIAVLESLIGEMERRYRLLERARVRKIEEYNTRHPEALLPYIVVVIDELADFMEQASKVMEPLLSRLCAKARAAGIHLVVATQRPSVDVISGVVKANLPSRLAFAVSSDVDSRTILDHGGAEKLLGRGDMLFLALEGSKPIRAQGASVTPLEIERLVDLWRAQGSPREPFAALDDVLALAEAEDPLEELIESAITFVRNTGKASTNSLKRHLRTGHDRAASIMSELEHRGIVGPAVGTMPRRVLEVSV